MLTKGAHRVRIDKERKLFNAQLAVSILFVVLAFGKAEGWDLRVED